MQISGMGSPMGFHSSFCGRRDVLIAQSAVAELQVVGNVRLLEAGGL